MIYKFAKVVGLNTDSDAAQVIISSDDPQSSFLGLLELSCDDAFTRGRQLLSDLVDFYQETGVEDKSEGERLKEVFTKALEYLKETKEPSIIIASLSGKVLYLIGQGGVNSYLRRLDKISTLDGNSGQLTSGFLQEGDRVFFATKNLTDQLGNDLENTLELTFEKWEEEMDAMVNIRTEVDSGNEQIELKPSLKRAGLIIDVLGDEVSENFIPSSDMVSEGKSSELGVSKIKKLIAVFNKVRLPDGINIFNRISSIFPRSGRVRLVLALVLMIIIASGAGLKYKSFRDQESASNFDRLLQQAEDDFKEAQVLKTLNPQEASLKLLSAKESLEKALSINDRDNRALELKKQIETEGGGISQKFEGNFVEFLDLDLIKKGFKAKNLSLSAGKILVLNPEDSTLAAVDISKKSQKILGGRDKLGEATYASINGSSVFVYSAEKGVLRIDTGSGEASTAAKPDKNWGEIADITGFGGNIYLLDKAENRIWKYLAVASGYSDKRNYLSEGVKVDFSTALRMQIESSIYILKQGGEMLRFTKGDPDHFSIGGLDKGIKDPKSFYTSSEVDNLYVLDSGNSRLVVLSKIGEYKGQYSGDKFGVATDLVVDEVGKKVYLLEGSKIYMVNLK